MSGREEAQLRALRRRAFRKQNGLCFWCKEQMLVLHVTTTDPQDPLLVSADHHPKPRHLGGTTVPGNVVAAHRKCNSARHADLERQPGKADPPGLRDGVLVYSTERRVF
jgi:5-methylcytosine-specific restriction endonuclease McrA